MTHPGGAWHHWPRSFPQIEKKDSKRTANGADGLPFGISGPKAPKEVAREQGRPHLFQRRHSVDHTQLASPVVSPSTSPRLPWYRNRTARPALFEKKKGEIGLDETTETEDVRTPLIGSGQGRTKEGKGKTKEAWESEQIGKGRITGSGREERGGWCSGLGGGVGGGGRGGSAKPLRQGECSLCSGVPGRGFLPPVSPLRPFPFLSFWASFLLARVPHGGPEAHGVGGGWNVCRGLDV